VEKATGKPVMNAIVWQDTRRRARCCKFSTEGGQIAFERRPVYVEHVLQRAEVAFGFLKNVREAAEACGSRRNLMLRKH